jgi:O-antigen/teichoic acid export membrane protein
MIKKLLFSNTSWSLLSNLLTAVLGFVNIAFIAHQNAQAEAGKWFMLLTVYTLLEMLRSGWVQTPFVRFFVVAADDLERSRLTAAAWQLLLLFTGVICLVMVPFFYFIKLENASFSLAKKFTVLWLISALPYQLLQWQLQARTLFKKLAIIRLVFPLAFTLLLLIQFKLRLPISTVVLGYALLQFLSAALGFAFGWLQFGKWRADVSAERRQLSGFGKYSMLTMVTSSLLRSSDQFIIAALLGPAAVAVYSIPQKLIEAIEIPVRSFASVAIPNATSLWNNQLLVKLRLFFYQQCGFLSVLIFPLLLVFLIFPSFIVNLLGGSKYHESAPLLQIFCFYAALIPLDRYCGVLLDASHRPEKNTLKVALMLVVNVAGDLLAIQFGWGLYGVAAASSVTFFLGIVIGWFQLKDILHVFALRTFWHEGVILSIHKLKRTTTA